MTNGVVSIPKWLLAVIPVASVLVGLGISYGIQKTTLQYESKRVDEYFKRLESIEKQLQLIPQIQNDLEWIKREIEKQRRND